MSLMLHTAVRQFERESRELENMYESIRTIDLRHQRLITEVLFLQGFSLWERAIENLFCRAICSGQYRDGSLPTNMVSCSSVQQAQNLILSHGRSRALRYAQWSNIRGVESALAHVLSNTEHCLVAYRNSNAVIDEMRIMRNHIAHGTRSTYIEFESVLSRKYGATSPIRSPGIYLRSSTFQPTMFKHYFISARAVIKSMAKS